MGMAGAGFEQALENTGNADSNAIGGAESGALGTTYSHFDLGIAAVVDAWPTLPLPIKAGILAIIQTATEEAAMPARRLI
jgi:hypothetical protein